jgi:hypothetical protein
MDSDERIQLAYDYKTLAKTDAGANIIRDLAKFCGEGTNPYVQSSFDRTATKCGKLSVILYIRKMLSDSPEPRQETALTEEIEKE